MTTTITESVGLQARPGHRYRARLIEGERWGSSGYYSREMLERDGPTVWPAGTQVYMDHPGVTEQHDRPERSVRDLAGKITSTPVYEADGLYADIEFYPHIAPIIEAMWEDVGMSIRAAGTAETGERDGRTGAIITSLSEGVSVDVVTRAGAGGKLVALLESARATIHEALPGGLVADDLEQRLDDTVGPEAWVVDFTDEWLVYRTWDGDDRALVQQTYTADEQGRITLTGTPTRVSRRVTYDALAEPTGTATIPPSSLAGVAMESIQKKEDPTMGHIQVDEAEHKRLTEAAEKLTATESERAAAIERAETAEKRIAEAIKQAESATVSRIVGEAGVQFSKWERAGIESALPRTEDGGLDEASFTERVKEAATEKANESGHGRPQGMGAGTGTESTTDISEAEADIALGITTQKGA